MNNNFKKLLNPKLEEDNSGLKKELDELIDRNGLKTVYTTLIKIALQDNVKLLSWEKAAKVFPQSDRSRVR